MQYETIIGLEVHVELNTDSKIYCSCTTEFGGTENTHCCPVCTGMPGMLPALNERMIEKCIRAGLATNCKIHHYSKQDRKHYYYPDLPKAFQTSQFDLPICYDGYVDIDVDGEQRRIGITRIHIEEDAGKLLHGVGTTRVDYNRGGVPLIEIVTEPDFRNAEEVKAFLETLRAMLLYIGVSNCRMEEGSLRCDVNLSVRPEGQKELNTRTEMKNLNSFSGAYRAVQYERARQIGVIEDGGVITQDTLRWDDVKNLNYAMRTKEDADDYYYFPEPDVMPLVFTDEYIDELRETIPELPMQRRECYINELELSEYDAKQITNSKRLSDLFDAVVATGAKAKQVANFITSDISRLLNEHGMDAEDSSLSVEQLSELLALIEKGVINRTVGSKVLEAIFTNSEMPSAIVEKQGLAQVSDAGEIRTMCEDAIAANPKAVEDYRAGKEKALTSLVGQVMKASKGKANPGMVNELLRDLLK